MEKQRLEWMGKLEPTGLFHRIFDHLPGLCFFAKDQQLRLMFTSRGILERYQMNDEKELLGLTDYDIYPNVMAEGYIADDKRLLTGKTKLIEHLELWFDRQGTPDWFVITKLPLLDLQGKPQGVMGVLRHAEEHEKRLPVFQTVSRAVEIIRRDYAQPLIMAQLARACGQSLRQLQRHFNSAFGITPQEFLLKTRVLTAARLLEQTSLTAVEIATQCGFADASSFTLHFRKRTKFTPTAYRKRKEGKLGDK